MEAVDPPTVPFRNLPNRDAGHADISLGAVRPIDVRVRDLKVEVDAGPSPWARIFNQKANTSENRRKIILHGVNADMPHGTLTAIIGASGSGKTSMLNVIANRSLGSGYSISGTTTFNGSTKHSEHEIAYVMQQDILISTLTVRETLGYAADLRLSSPKSKKERQKIVEEVIVELGLKDCADTKIGDSAHKGCSGGEKRRTSIGVQLLANPSVLFCDEPTTGLDANSAFQVAQTLRDLSRNGRTVVISIHQPRSEIWSLIDRVVLLARGTPLFSGLTEHSIPHFAELGHELPPFVNPAEFLVDLAAIDNRSEEAEAQSSNRVDGLESAWKTKWFEMPTDETSPLNAQRRGNQSEAVPSEHETQTVTFSRQFSVLTTRNLIVTVRDPMGLAGSFFEAVGMAITNGWIFVHLGTDLQGIRSRQGALYIASALQGYLILIFEVYRLTIDIQIFDRERNEGVVTVGAFLLSRRLARLFLEDVPVPLIFSLIFYFMVGFRIDAQQFVVFFAINLLAQYIAVCLATLCVSISRHFAGASLVANLVYTLQSMACGYFVQADQIPVWTRWLKWTCYSFYAFSALAVNEFIGFSKSSLGQFYDCPYSNDPSDPACKEYTGEFIVQALGFISDWRTQPILALLGYVLAFYTGAALLLQFWCVELDTSRARRGDTDHSAGKEKIAPRSHADVRTVDIRLQSYSLEIMKKERLGFRSRHIPILRPISTEFQAGTLNVIMGPSGSGKTSFLQIMGNRLHNSLATTYRRSGWMLYNGSIPSPSVVRSISSFVVQDDDALMPHLTVREALHFAARIRLPSWMSTTEKIQKAEDVLFKMGLKDCANNVIGNELKKGISGGEKRRVSIAIQILNDPRVLLLDEPTSGLDAFTAMSIIDVLRGLANEKRTVIMTVHQSRSDVFGHFGNVLLLARGGYPVYTGRASDMLAYFSGLGYDCPQAANPSDFALDLISSDLRSEAKEAESRQKVQKLVAGWNAEKTALARQSQGPSDPKSVSTPAELGSLARKTNPFWFTFPVVLQRSWINLRRQQEVVIARIMQILSMGIILALFFAPLKHNYESVQSRFGLIQEFAALYFVGMLQNIAVYPYEKDVFYREEADAAYSVEVFLASYTLLEIPFEITSSVVFGVIAAFAIDIQRTAKMCFIAAFNSFCIVSCGESVGILFNTFFSHVGFAVQVTSILISISTVLAGVMSLNVPGFLQALNHLSPLKYSIANLAPYSLEGIHFTCATEQRLPNGHCPIETGSQALALYNLNKNAPLNLMAMGVCTILYRLLAYLVLKLVKSHWGDRMRKTKGSVSKNSADGVEMSSISANATQNNGVVSVRSSAHSKTTFRDTMNDGADVTQIIA